MQRSSLGPDLPHAAPIRSARKDQHVRLIPAVCFVLACAGALGGGSGALLGCRALPGPFALVEVHGPPADTFAPLTAGVAVVDWTPAKGYPLGGYGGRARRRVWPFLFGAGWPGRLALDWRQWLYGDDPDTPADMLEPARGVHDPLFAKALVLEAGGHKLALVRFDAVVGSDLIHDGVAARVAALGFAKAAVIVAANHTHAGAGAYLPERAAKIAGTDNFRKEMLERIITACAQAIEAADATRRPAAIGFGRAIDRGPDGRAEVSVNRRASYLEGVAPDDLDPEIGLVKVSCARTGGTLAVLVNYAVHPTVMGTDNMHFSGDLAGAIERQLERALAGTGTRGRSPPVLFFNGAEGDAGPKENGGLLTCERLGAALARHAAPAVRAIPAIERRVRLRAAYGVQDHGSPYVFLALGGRERYFAFDECMAARVATFPLTLAPNLLLWLLGLTDARLALHANGTFGMTLELGGYARTSHYRYHALSIEGERGAHAAMVSFPGEPLHKVGLAAKAAMRARGAEHAFVLSLANGAIGYIADEAEYFRGGYEAYVTLYGPATAARSLLAAESCLDALAPGPPQLDE